MRVLKPHRRRIAVAMAGTAAIAALLGASGAAATPGDLDPSFSGNGKATTAFAGGQDVARAVAVQPDARSVVVGEDGGNGKLRWALARYLPGGSLDPSFGGDGMVTTDFGDHPGSYAATGVALQANGKIVVAGEASDGDFAVARYLLNGALDDSFSDDGKKTTNFGGVDVARDVALIGGRIIVAGYSGQDFAVASYELNGLSDSSFGGGTGRVTTDFGSKDYGIGLAPYPGGRFVVVGLAAGFRNFDIGVARYLANGDLDTSFDGGVAGDGALTFEDPDFSGTPSTAFDAGHDVAVLGDGGMVIAGEIVNRFGLLRLDADGNPLSSFDGDGFVTTDFLNQASAREVLVQPGGKIVLAGDSEHDRFALARYDVDGSLDTSFGPSASGKVTTDFGGYDAGRAAAFQPDGRLVVAGVASPGSTFDFGVARYFTGPIRRCGGEVASIVATSKRVSGGPEADVIDAGSADHRIDARGRGDSACAGGGGDVVKGGGGGDRLLGEGGADLLSGGDGADTLRGGPGADTLRGGPGEDRCDGGGGSDTFTGCEHTSQ